MIGAEAAAFAANRTLRELAGPRHESVVATLMASERGAALRVDRLDVPGQAYYLIPWSDSRGVVLIAQVDAGSGQLASFALLSAPQPHLVLPVEAAQSLVAAQLPVIGPARLVWQPCRESAGPLQPLYAVPVASGTVFVGADAQLHRRLTPFGQGG